MAPGRVALRAAAMLLACAATASAAASVWGVTASAGSLGGRTKVLIQGAGFQRDGEDGSTAV